MCPLNSPSGLPPSRGHSLAVESHEADTRLAAVGESVVHASGCQASPEMRSACPRSVAMHRQSGTLQSLISADHEPVATTPEPGEKQTKEMGRSSPKFESWFCTNFSRDASR